MRGRLPSAQRQTQAVAASRARLLSSALFVSRFTPYLRIALALSCRLPYLYYVRSHLYPQASWHLRLGNRTDSPTKRRSIVTRPAQVSVSIRRRYHQESSTTTLPPRQHRLGLGRLPPDHKSARQGWL